MSNTNTKVTRTSKVVAEKGTLLTPYKAASLVNAELEKAGLSKRIPPQMMYNYTTAKVNAGKKPIIKYDPSTGEVDAADLKRWTKAYIAKQATPSTEE
jgi:hypothetical protein